MLLSSLLKRMIKQGTLTLVHADGRRESFGDGNEPSATFRLQKKGLERYLAFNPALRVPETYMDGTVTLEEDSDLRALMDIIARNWASLESQPFYQWGNRLLRQGRRLKQFNPVGKAQQNVAHHYDLSGVLYDHFLDSDRQYSCAYFTHPDNSLEQAQYDKKQHLAAKLYLTQPGLKTLDIGSGWGGLGLYLANELACDVTGVTLSVEQHKMSQERAEKQGLQGRCRFKLEDYRNENGPYDRIVSVGMFEHVGKQNYDEFFSKLKELLADDGVCVLHSIGRLDEPSPINPFIRKYIFPGADIPTLSEVMASVERSGLFTTDVEVLRLHYAETLRHWYERFLKTRAQVAELYDERFCRMWEMYLAGCEMGFRHQGLAVFQIQLTKRLETLPLTRDYIFEWERERSRGQAKAAE
ncbi:cyclopropane-fatty-acyl-phospholipid synthase family protein [Aquibaculum sediminis]|uniref:cyclopropane-fatty-acyl-phospholipid synthase family protein n=1 Tax=Aquibaculum sediminis TaxID=3231907 RepID=UPI003455F151